MYHIITKSLRKSPVVKNIGPLVFMVPTFSLIIGTFWHFDKHTIYPNGWP